MQKGQKEIPLSVPNLDMEIVDNLKECIATGWVSTGGRFITEFERKIAKYAGDGRRGIVSKRNGGTSYGIAHSRSAGGR